MKPPEKNNITAVVLAGGRGRRLGGLDKGLLSLEGKPLIEHIIDAIKPQAGTIIINANRNRQEYSAYGYPVISDDMTDYQGPLAGFAAALSACKTDYIITLPCDGPTVPPDLVSRLAEALINQNAELAVAHDGTRMQRVYALIPCALLDSLQAFLDTGDRTVGLWYAQHNVAQADFSDVPDTFFNINTEEDRLTTIKQEIPE
jgi:molybdenum cofactor guanylyltransferase